MGFIMKRRGVLDRSDPDAVCMPWANREAVGQRGSIDHARL